MKFTMRNAQVGDIDQILKVRNSVKENVLSNPERVSNQDCEEYITQRGKGWVAEVHHQIVGFAIVDVQDHNVWALFMNPNFEGQGIGKKLHDTMLEWYFSSGKLAVWLSTEPGTRAEVFYQKQGWKKVGLLPNGEVKFEMTAEEWKHT